MAALGTWRAECAVCIAEQGVLLARPCAGPAAALVRVCRDSAALWNRRDLWVLVCILLPFVM